MMSKKHLLLQVLEKVEEIQKNQEELLRISMSQPEWILLSDVARLHGLTTQAVRKRVLNGNYEDGVDYKYIHGRIYIARSAISKFARMRK